MKSVGWWLGSLVVCERSEAKHYIPNFHFQRILSGPCGDQRVVGWGTLRGGAYSVLQLIDARKYFVLQLCPSVLTASRASEARE